MSRHTKRFNRPVPPDDEFRMNDDDSVDFGTRTRENQTKEFDEHMQLAVEWVRMTERKRLERAQR